MPAAKARDQGHALLRAADPFYKPWHAYDEWENRRSVRAATFVTAAGGFCLALHVQLLAETAPGEWSFYPGAPADWTDLSFDHLHPRVGWAVSARRKGGRTVSVSAFPICDKADPLFTLIVPDLAPEAHTISEGLTADRARVRLRFRREAPTTPEV